jgi:carbamoyl-phosphate synthase large subunit
MNVQFAIKGNDIFVLEVNPRASRTVPFVAKATGRPIASIAARVMAGEKLASFNLSETGSRYFAVKEAVLPFARFPGVDTLLGPEMRSTGEVMGLDDSFPKAFLKAQIGAGTMLPDGGTVFVSIKDSDKNPQMLESCQILTELGFKLLATRGTSEFLEANGLATETINKVYEGRPHIVDRLSDGEVSLIFNTTEGAQAVADSREIRRVALYDRIPYFTTANGAHAAALAIRDRDLENMTVTALQAM